MKKPIGPPLATEPKQREFFRKMQRLVLHNGDPSLAVIAKKVHVRKQAIHRALRGPDLPSRDLVVAIAAALLPDDEAAGIDRSADRDEALKWWTLAVQDLREVRHHFATTPVDPRKELANELSRFRYEAGSPALSAIREATGIAPSSLSDWFAGKSMPRDQHELEMLLDYLEAQGGDRFYLIEQYRDIKASGRERRR